MPQFDTYLAGLRARRESERKVVAAAREQAFATARALAKVLRDRYGARRVVLVGSLARGDFRLGSDIDLVVEGLPEDALFRAGADLEALAGDIEVDLVPLEAATSAFVARAVAAEGIVLE